jgi:glycosyltransferase involved in cell wall biosynthesis
VCAIADCRIVEGTSPIADDELRDSRCVLAAASSRAAAERFAHEHRLSPLVLSRHELISSPLALRRVVTEGQIETAIIHSSDWGQETAPQFYELLLALLPVSRRYLVDEAGCRIRRLGRGRLALRSARLPIEALHALARIGTELLRAPATADAALGINPVGAATSQPAVIAIWLGTISTSVGGSVTHISGILKGFRTAGFGIGLISAVSPPPQLRAVVDELELCDPLPPSLRLTADISDLAINAPARIAGMRLLERLQPTFVYQRHRQFLTAGRDLARAAGVPLVLEYNGSETWVREHWSTQIRVERLFTPISLLLERRMLRQSDLIVAISDHAARMALEDGADVESLIITPNGVDFSEVDAAVPTANRNGTRPPTVGWIGSFGPWHGAEVLIRALPMLGDDVELVMIGDGTERLRCQALAEELGVGARIEWPGVLPHDQALRRLSMCDVLASPHVQLRDRPFFGSPTKLFEYMALGKPIVASRLEQIGEILEDGSTAVLVEPGDPTQLAQGLDRVLGAPERARELGEAARREASRFHTWEHRAKQILDRLAICLPAGAA